MTGWRRSTHCSFGDCIEVRHAGGRVELRDSNRPGQIVWCREHDWAAFVAGVKNGEFDGDPRPS